MKPNPNGRVPENRLSTAAVADPNDPALADLHDAICIFTRPALTNVHGLVCTVRRDGPRVRVDLNGPPIDGWREKALAVRVLDAVRSVGRTYGQVDVIYHTRAHA